MSNTYLGIFVTVFNQKSIQRHPICMTDTDYEYILDEIERREILSLNRMLVLIVTRNIADDNNHNAILYVVFQYRIIKYQYVNIIWIFKLFSMFSILREIIMFILFKDELVPKFV